MAVKGDEIEAKITAGIFIFPYSKGFQSVISSETTCQNDNARFTIFLIKALSDQR